MDFNNTSVMFLAKTSMKYQGQRQAELSRNIANIDTPNYQARDLKPLNFERLAEMEAKRLEMRATAPTHMTGVKLNTGPYKSNKDRETFESTPVKNNVVLEEQMAAVNETGLNYQLANSVYKKMNTLIKTAVGTR